MSKLASVDDWWDLSDEEREAFVSAHERRVGIASGATVAAIKAAKPGDIVNMTSAEQGELASDAVFRPSHYVRWAIEPITFISANNLDFLTGNVIKYVMRHDAKNGLEDLRKAARYLEILIGHVEREKAGEQIKVQSV